MQQAKKDGAEMYPSGSSKQLKEPQIGKLDRDYTSNLTPSNNHKNKIIEADLESLHRRLETAERENEDLKINLQLNKDSLQSMMLETHRSANKEASLIETINIISKDNGLLKEQIEHLKERINNK